MVPTSVVQHYARVLFCTYFSLDGDPATLCEVNLCLYLSLAYQDDVIHDIVYVPGVLPIEHVTKDPGVVEMRS